MAHETFADELRAAVAGDKHTIYTELMLQAAELLDEKMYRLTPVAPVSPDATGKCGELETVAQIDTGRKWRVHFLTRPVRGEELVTRSQAEAIIAAERAEKEEARRAEEEAKDCFWAIYETYLENGGLPVSTEGARSALSNRIATLEAELDFVGRVKGVNEKYANALAFLEMTENDDPEEFAECFWNKFIALEADNAALTARVEELETRLEFDPGGGDRIDALESALGFSKHRNEALEAKLAAAEKALEPFAEHANHRAVDDTGWRDKETVKIVVSIGDLRKARAALGGKPS